MIHYKKDLGGFQNLQGLIITKFLCIFLFISSSIFAQNTVGLLSYVPSQSFDGYNLIFPHNQPDVYLLNNCGEIVNIWTDDADFRPGNMAYLLPSGNLVKTKRSGSVGTDPIWAGGGGDYLEIYDWDNNLLWSFRQNDASARLHHDIAPMDNGNILVVSWEYKSPAEVLAAGRDTSQLTQDVLWPDYVFEIQPIGTDSFNIVWEWHAWDHLIQDFDSTKANYGVVGDHPELIDLNWDTNNGGADWMHVNAIDFHEDLNQIIISVPTFHEVWIIDHSTTTAQAAGSTGGLGKVGGDLMYRWGNPAAYRQGDSSDQTLFYQHDIHWIDDFLDASNPYFGKFGVFNNRVTEDSSSVGVFDPGWDMYEWEYLNNDTTWGPESFDWVYSHPEKSKMHSTGLSSLQFLPNGNALICAGRLGYAFEVTPSEEIVWEYKTPLLGGHPIPQGDSLVINNNLTFRMTRYPTDYKAFTGKTLVSKGYIELDPDTAFCESLISSIDEIPTYGLKIYPNPASDRLTLEWEKGFWVDIEIYDAIGRFKDRLRTSGGRTFLNISDWQEGIYFVRINGTETRKLVVRR